MRSLPVNQ